MALLLGLCDKKTELISGRKFFSIFEKVWLMFVLFDKVARGR